MRLVQVWNYFMRRKPLIVALFVLGMSGFGGFNLARQEATRREEVAPTGVAEIAKMIDNGLAFQILDENQGQVAKITLQNNYQQARVEAGTSSLASGAYVRIIDAAGSLLAGEYTRMYDAAQGPAGSVQGSGLAPGSAGEAGAMADMGVQYYFPETPKDYTVALTPGARIEIQARKVKFLSTLDGLEIAEYAPRAETESYIITEKGLKRADWEDAQVQEVMYRQMRRYANQQIDQYRVSIPEHVLYNKTLDAAKKAEVLQLYAELLPIDREMHTEFVEQLRRGGVPVITYRGAAEYKREERVDLSKLVDVRDNEDGTIASEKLVIEGEVDFSKAGKYDVIYSTADSDGNVAQLKLTISVSETLADTPSQTPNEDRPAQTPSDSNAGDAGGDSPAGGDDSADEGGSAGDAGLPGSDAEIGGIDAGDSETFEPVIDAETAGGTGTVLDTPAPKVDYVPAGEEVVAGTIEEPPVAMIDTGTATTGVANNNTTTPTTEKKTEKTAEKPAEAEEKATAGGAAKGVLFVVLGVIMIGGLAKFISDRYVR